ncbi:CNH domain-containing protein [Favolaschia claudopus]|uniref:CNH domain-containing protein n=1 Tax=Favolaschia claudopus TaxID=2862362 RepID=A0AAW0BZA8_9AGAR
MSSPPEKLVELQRYHSNIVFKSGEFIDLDLLNDNRSLLHTGTLSMQLRSRTWSEVFVLLFDNYLVITGLRETDGTTQYHVVKRPVPLELLTLVNFTDPPVQRGNPGLLNKLRGGAAAEAPTDGFPCMIRHNARAGGSYVMYADTAQVRTEWQRKLVEALSLRRVVQESNKVFEVEMLNSDTLDKSLTGKITCSVPFNTPDGRALMAIGGTDGVWVGSRPGLHSVKRVLDLQFVTQLAVVEDFGVFIVLANETLFAYHIEALAPSSPPKVNLDLTPQKLGNKAQFFVVGNLHGRILVAFMKKKANDSIFRMVEPIPDKINQQPKTSTVRGSPSESPISEWFRVYRDFFLEAESFDLVFLKARIVITTTSGFEVMDLSDFKSVTIPPREQLDKQLVKRMKTCRPVGAFRVRDGEEFLLCFNEFGLYVTKHGDPSPTRSVCTVEWEGNVQRAVLQAPYLLLFDADFIEVRDLGTGRLVQIIPGQDIRCLWDGRGRVSVDGQRKEKEELVRIQAVMNIMGRQRVFQLVPLVPLSVIPESQSTKA